ncbi:MAG: hypothetical protein K6A44_01240 [bacterium]|nr:hypothetical protein [bacterium]
MEKEKITDELLDKYVDLDWTMEFGEDLDFEGKPYHYLRLKEFEEFCYCGKTKEICLQNYKKQLRLLIRVMLEFDDHIPEPGEFEED